MKKKVTRILSIIFIILIVYSSYHIIIWYKDNKNNSLIKEKIKKYIEIDEDNSIYKIDFNSLKEKNNDTIAYLRVNNTNIDYIVVKGNDNKYYLKHNFDKESNISGWIFMDHRNKYDGNDKNLIIYGHNMRDGSMFGTLKNIITKEWYQNKDNHLITLINEQGEEQYQVFSTYSIKVEDYYITTDFKNDDEYAKFLNKLKSRSVYDYNVSLKDTASILTLSTCSSNGAKRMVLHARELI